MSKTSYHLRRMSDRLWMLLLVTVVIISTTIVLQEKTRRLETESSLEELRTELLLCKVKTTKLEVLLSQEVRKLKTEEVPKTATGNSGYAADPLLVRQFNGTVALKKNQFITGIGILNKEIFVINLNNNIIERFDSTTLSAKRMLTLPGHESLRHLQPCSQSRILVIVDKRSTNDTRISIVDPFSKELLASWPVDSSIEALSVTKDCRVIAACPDKNRIIEYSSSGYLIQEIVLKSEIRPRLALKMTNGNYLVAHYGNLGQIAVGLAILNSNGNVLKSYLEPTHRELFTVDMAIDRLGNILVASLNGRVLLFSSDLEYERDLVSRDSGIGMITAMLLDEVNRRLIVSDSNYNKQGPYFDNARILVFDLQ